MGAAAQAWGAEMQAEVAALGGIVQRQGLADLGPVVFHASTLRRALLNLVHNAADAMPHGGTVTLAGQGTATHVQLEVQDTGNGIPAKCLAQIFEPLYTTKPGGTGLGLYIVHEIVAAHDGQITVASTEGQGTTVTRRCPGPRARRPSHTLVRQSRSDKTWYAGLPPRERAWSVPGCRLGAQGLSVRSEAPQ